MEHRRNPMLRWWALCGVCLLAFTAYLDATIVNTALPFIKTALKANILQLQWIANIFTIVLSMTMIIMGHVGDIFGRKKVFYIGVLIFAIAAFGAGFSKVPAMLVFFRGLQSIGASTIFVVAAALLTNVFEEKERMKAISIYGGVTGLGLMIGPFLGGILVATLGWKWVFWINLPLIAIGLVLCSIGFKGKVIEKHAAKIDIPGFLLLTVGLGSLMYGIIKGAESDWSSIFGWACLVVGIIFLGVLIALDEIKKHPLLDLAIFKNKLIVLAALSCSLGGVISTVFLFFDPLYLRMLRGFSPLMIGILIAVIPAAQVLISFSFQRLVRSLGIANLLLMSIALAAVAIGLHQMIEKSSSIAFLILPFFVLGMNWGLSNAGMMAAISEGITPRKIGSAIGTIATIWNLAGAVLLATSTAVFHNYEKKASLIKASFLPAFHAAMWLNLLFALAVLLVASCVFIKMRKERIKPE